MKKLVVLMVVLGLASLASAVPVLSIGGPSSVAIGNTITLTVSSNNTEAYTAYVGFDPVAAATITGVAATASAGEQAAVTASPYGYANYFTIEAKDTSDPFNSVAAGVQFNISFKGLAQGAVDVLLFDNTFSTVVGTQRVTVTPEPATLAILGLGALLLRRKK